jgi:hypothetical protein
MRALKQALQSEFTRTFGATKKIRAVRGKPSAQVFDPEIAGLLPRAGAAHSKDFWHDRSGMLRLMFD